VNVHVQGEALVGFLLASVRIISWLVVVPPFASRSIPTMAKVVLAVGLSFAVAPSVAGSGVPLSTPGLIVNVLTQVLIGVGMGFVTALLLGAISAAGSLIDVFGGFSLAQGFDPLGMNTNTVFGTFHQLLATALLFASGGYLIVLGGLLQTFDFLPVGTAPGPAWGPEVFTTAFSMFFVTAVQIALPMIAVLFIADLGLALMTKVAPQLNALNVMFPAKIGLTLLLVGLSFPALPGAMDHMVELATEAMSVLSGAG
jgi:flagellar biosynthesis protein FliR